MVSVSNDGAKAAFRGDWLFDNGIFILNTDGSGTAAVINGKGAPNISGDGNKVFYLCSSAGGLCAANTDGINIQTLRPNVNPKEITSDYAGNLVAYQENFGSSNSEIYLYNYQNDELIKITNNTDYDDRFPRMTDNGFFIWASSPVACRTAPNHYDTKLFLFMDTGITSQGIGQLVDMRWGVNLLYRQVKQAGRTKMEVNDQGPELPAGFSHGSRAWYYHLSTTAQYSGQVKTCITYDETLYSDESLLHLLRYDGAWTDITMALDTDSNTICGFSAGLGDFTVVMGQDSWAIGCLLDPDLDSDCDGLSNADETGVFNTNPMDPDSDYDGVNDGQEIENGLDPLSWDSDHDALPDKFELDNPQFSAINPDDGLADLDGDKISNADEYWNGSRIDIPDPVGYGAAGDNRSFWADSGSGDGVVGPEDLSVMRSLVAGDFSNMAMLKFYNVIPTSGQTLDLDLDGVFTATDLSILRDMFAGRDCNYAGGMPSVLELADSPLTSVQVGYTTHIGVKVKAQTLGKYMTGAAVVFAIDTIQSTGAATILGGDGPAIDHPDYGKYRWDQTGKLNTDATDEAPARIIIRVDAAGTIVINISTPEVGTPGQGRYIPHLELSPPVQIQGIE